MKKVIIFGLAQFAELLAYYLTESNEYEVAAYTVDAKYIPSSSEGLKYPVIPFETLDNIYSPREYGIFICAGYNQMNHVRERAYMRAKRMGYEVLSYIHPTAVILTNKIGEGTIILEHAVVGPFAKIGTGNIVWASANIAHHTCVGNFNFFAIASVVAGNVEIGNNCFFGSNCTIKDGIHIRDYTLVGAGCYVAHDTETYSVHVPARSDVLEGKSSLDMRFTQG